MNFDLQRHIWPLVLALASFFPSCSERHEPTPPANYTSGIAIYYNTYYSDKGNDAHIWELEFYSGTVEPTRSGYTGTGQILTITDLFATAPTADQPLPLGSYTIDDTYLPYTATTGTQQSGYDLGTYITTLVDGQISAIEYITAGSITIAQPTDETEAPGNDIAQDQTAAVYAITFDLQRRSGTLYHNTFLAPLPLYLPQ